MFRKKQPDNEWANTQARLKELCQRVFDVEAQCVGQPLRFCDEVFKVAGQCRVMMVVLGLGESQEAPRQAFRARAFSSDERAAIVEAWHHINEDAFKLVNPVLRALTVAGKGYRCFCCVGNSIVRATVALKDEKTFGYPAVGDTGGIFS